MCSDTAAAAGDYVDEAFVDLVVSDPALLDAEFEAIVAANWPDVLPEETGAMPADPPLRHAGLPASIHSPWTAEPSPQERAPPAASSWRRLWECGIGGPHMTVMDRPLAGPGEQGDSCEAALADARKEIDNLRAALITRHGIGVAQGILMAHYGLSEDQAFAYLARISQDSNVKVRDVARRLVEETCAGS